MPDILNLIDGLASKDNTYAYQCLKGLETESKCSAKIYSYFDIFATMLDNPNSYIRTRGIILIAANAKWDIDYKIDEIIDKLLKHITDDKPITARQCIKVMPVIAKHKTELKNDIEKALLYASLSIYRGSMQPLILKDIKKSLEDIKNLPL